MGIGYEIRIKGAYKMNQEIGDKNILIDNKLGGGQNKDSENVY